MLILIGLVIDQITKIWAVSTFSLPSGAINYAKSISVIGQWFQLKLIYNEGAAFGLQPQKIATWMHPTLFFGLISAIAIIGLFFFYRSIPNHDKASQWGIALIISGAFGNLADRLRLSKVVDFLDVGIPGVDPRWPTFNIADSLVCVGVAIIILWPMFQKKSKHSNSSPSRL